MEGLIKSFLMPIVVIDPSFERLRGQAVSEIVVVMVRGHGIMRRSSDYKLWEQSTKLSSPSGYLLCKASLVGKASQTISHKSIFQALIGSSFWVRISVFCPFFFYQYLFHRSWDINSALRQRYSGKQYFQKWTVTQKLLFYCFQQ